MLHFDDACLTCFQQPGNQISNIKSNGNSTAIDVLKKHLWFTDEDLEQAKICQSCWDQVNSFHTFYASVEKLYQERLVSLVVKSEPDLEESYPEPQYSASLPPVENECPIDNEFESDSPEKDPDEYIRRHVKYLCELCGEDSKGFTLYLRHAREVHGTKSPFLTCCGKRFYKRIRLMDHVQSLENPNCLRCDQCTKKFYSKDKLVRHTKKFHPTEEQLVEPVIDRVKKHEIEDDFIQTHVKMIRCGQCGKESRTFNLLAKHTRIVHNSMTTFAACCGKRFYTKAKLLAHVRTFNTNFSCISCNVTFDTRSGLKLHMRAYHIVQDQEIQTPALKENSSVSTIVQCETVMKEDGPGLKVSEILIKTENQDELGIDAQFEHSTEIAAENIRQNVVEGEEQARDAPKKRIWDSGPPNKESPKDDEYIRKHVSYICVQCGHESVSFTHYKKHAQNVHEQKSVYLLCCDRRFYTRIRLLEHVKYLNNPHSFSCNRCEKSFINGNGLDRHLKKKVCRKVDRRQRVEPMKETLEKKERLAMEDECIRTHVKYLCEHCEHESQSFSLFRRHYAVVHDSKAAYVACCGKRYYKKILLLQHVQTLTNPDMFRCELCRKSFMFNYSLQKHMNDFHLPEEERHFNCDRCPRGFSDQRLYEKHMQDHLGFENQSFKCKQCNRNCRTQRSLNYHIREKHVPGTGPRYFCGRCSKSFRAHSWYVQHQMKHARDEHSTTLQAEER